MRTKRNCGELCVKSRKSPRVQVESTFHLSQTTLPPAAAPSHISYFPLSAPCPCPRLYNTPPTHHIHNPPTTLRPTPAASSTSQQLTIRLFTLLYPLRYPLHPLHPLCSSTLPPSPSSVKSCVFLLSIAYTLPHSRSHPFPLHR